MNDDYKKFFPHDLGLKPNQPKKEDKLIRFLTLHKITQLIEQRALHFHRLDKFPDQNEGIWTNNDTHLWKNYKFDVPKFSREFRITSAITCWSKIDKNLNTSKMWEKYVPDDQGLAIVTTPSLLCDLTRNGLIELGAEHAHILIAEVQYIDRNTHSNIKLLKPADPLCNATLPYYQKDKSSYSFENEVRLLVNAGLKDKIPMAIADEGVNIPIDSMELITEIWFPPTISNTNKETLCKLLIKHRLDSKINVGATLGASAKLAKK